jgi:hypothetical protein
VQVTGGPDECEEGGGGALSRTVKVAASSDVIGGDALIFAGRICLPHPDRSFIGPPNPVGQNPFPGILVRICGGGARGLTMGW